MRQVVPQGRINHRQLQCLKTQGDFLGARALVIQIDQTIEGDAGVRDAQNAVRVLPHRGGICS